MKQSQISYQELIQRKGWNKKVIWKYFGKGGRKFDLEEILTIETQPDFIANFQKIENRKKGVLKAQKTRKENLMKRMENYEVEFEPFPPLDEFVKKAFESSYGIKNFDRLRMKSPLNLSFLEFKKLIIDYTRHNHTDYDWEWQRFSKFNQTSIINSAHHTLQENVNNQIANKLNEIGINLKYFRHPKTKKLLIEIAKTLRF